MTANPAGKLLYSIRTGHLQGPKRDCQALNAHLVESLRQIGRGVIHLNATTFVASGING